MVEPKLRNFTPEHDKKFLKTCFLPQFFPVRTCEISTQHGEEQNRRKGSTHISSRLTK